MSDQTNTRDYDRLLQPSTGAHPELAEHVYRWWAKRAHPDAGGTHAAAVGINAAITVIREHAPRSGAA